MRLLHQSFAALLVSTIFLGATAEPSFAEQVNNTPFNLNLELSSTSLISGDQVNLTAELVSIDVASDLATLELELSDQFEYLSTAGTDWECSFASKLLTCTSPQAKPETLNATLKVRSVETVEFAGVFGEVFVGLNPEARRDMAEGLQSHQDFVLASVHPAPQGYLVPKVLLDDVDHSTGARINLADSKQLAVTAKNESGTAVLKGESVSLVLTPDYSGKADFSGWGCGPTDFRATESIECSLTLEADLKPGDSLPSLDLELEGEQEGEWDVSVRHGKYSSMVHGFRVHHVETQEITGAIYVGSHMLDGNLVVSVHNTSPGPVDALLLLDSSTIEADQCSLIGIGTTAVNVCSMGAAPQNGDSAALKLKTSQSKASGLVLDRAGTVPSASFSEEFVESAAQELSLALRGPISVISGARVSLNAIAAPAGIVQWQWPSSLSDAESSDLGSKLAFTAPEVSERSQLSFTASAKHNGEEVTEVISLFVLPKHTSADELRFFDAAPQRYSTMPASKVGKISANSLGSETLLSASSASVSLNSGASNLMATTGASLALNASVVGLVAPVSYQWKSSSSSATITGSGGSVNLTATTAGNYTVSVVATSGAVTATSEIAVTVSDPKSSPAICSSVAQLTGGQDSVAFGPLVLSGLSNAKPVTSADCPGSGGVELVDTTATLFEFITLTNVTGRIDTVGIALESATLSVAGLEGFGTFELDQGLSATWTEAGELGEISAIAVAKAFPYLELPDGFVPEIRLLLTQIGSGQGLTLAGVISHADDEAKAISIDGPLPLEGESYNFVLGGTAFTFGSVGVLVSGSISGQVGQKPESVTAAAALTAPVELFGGLTLNSLAVDFGETDITGDFGFTIDTGKENISLTASGQFADEENFSLTLALDESSTSSWQPVSGVNIDASNFQGSLSSADGEYTFDVSLGLAGSYSPMAGFALTGLAVDINNECETPPTSGSCAVQIGLSGTGAMDLSSYGINVKTTAAASGELNTQTGGFVINANVDGIDLGFTKLDNGQAIITHDPSAPAATQNTVVLSGTGNLLSQKPSITVLLTPDGFMAQGQVNTAPPGGGAQQVNFAYANFDGTFDPSFGAVNNAPSLALLQGVTVGVIPMAVPKPIETVLGADLPTGYAKFNLGGSAESLELFVVPPPNLYIFGSGSSNSSLELNSITIDVSFSSAGTSFELGGDAVFIFGSTNLDMFADLSFAQTETGVTLSGAFELNAEASGGWKNALGIQQLTINDFAISVSIDELGVPGFGIAGDAVLPDSVESALGLVDGSEIVMFMDLAAETPCLGLHVSNGNNYAIKILGGALSAYTAGFTFAPFGCTIAQDVYPAGYSLEFASKINGVAVDVSSLFELVPDFTFQANVDVGTFDIGAVTLSETVMSVDIQPLSTDIYLAGGMQVDATKVAATAIYKQDSTGVFYDISAEADPITIGTVEIQKASLDAQVKLGETTSFALNVAGDMLVGGYPEQANLAVTIVDGKVSKFSGNATLDIPIDDVEIKGTVAATYVAPSPPSLAFSGSLIVNGQSLESASGMINDNGIQVQANLSIPSLANATLEGAYVWGDDSSQQAIQLENLQGEMVDGAVGDYSFVAKNVSLTPGGFSASGDFYLLKLDGATSFKGDAHLVVGTEVDVQIAGEFDSDGSYQLSGEGKFNAASGFGFDAQFEVDHTSTDYVAVSGDLNIPNTVDVTLAGNYEKDSTGQALYTFSGNGDLYLGSDKEALSARLSNDPNNNPGFSGSTSLSLGSGMSGSGDIVVKPAGLWWFDGQGTLSTSGVRADMELDGGSCSDINCTTKLSDPAFFASGDVKVSGITFNGKVNFDSAGNFDSKLSVTGNVKGNWSKTVTIVIAPVTFKGSYNVTYQLTAELKNDYAKVSFKETNKSSSGDGSIKSVSGSVDSNGKVSGSVEIEVSGQTFKEGF